MSDKQVRAVILFSLAGGFIRLYTGRVSATATKVQRSMKKSLRTIHASNEAEYLVMVKVIDEHWQRILGELDAKLEIMNLVSYILSYEPEVSKRFGVSEKLVRQFSTVQIDDVLLDIELLSKDISKQLIDGIYGDLGLTHPTRANLSMLKNKVRNELILEGKIV